VSIEWDHNELTRTLHMVWRERGGPTVREPPVSAIGLDLIQSTIDRELHGSLALSVEANGLRRDVRLPTGELKTR
jgi:two-component sensor histidine kinase